tara:strand:- start:580 stop:933 length:354 start_codon:yes stop_codon:yes gene_type:complete
MKIDVILANWVYSGVCKPCREAATGHVFAEHEVCNVHLAVISWLLGRRVSVGELRRLRQWVRFRRGGNGQWRVIEEKMQREMVRRKVVRRKVVSSIKWQEIGIDNIDYWENWQEANE